METVRRDEEGMRKQRQRGMDERTEREETEEGREEGGERDG